MFNKKMQYVIKSVPTDDKQALEDLLNEIEEEPQDDIEVQDEAEVVVEVEEEVKDEVCPKCGQDPCECEEDKDDEEQRKEQQAKAKQLVE